MLIFRVNESVFINTLLSLLPTPSRRGNLWHFHRLKWQISYWFTYTLSEEDMFYKVTSTFLWKTKRRAVLRTIDDFQKNADCGVRFKQENNYMASPVWIPQNVLRTCSVSQVAFYHGTDLNLVVTYIICWYILRMQSNTYDPYYDEAFWRQQSTAKRR